MISCVSGFFSNYFPLPDYEEKKRDFGPMVAALIGPNMYSASTWEEKATVLKAQTIRFFVVCYFLSQLTRSPISEHSPKKPTLRDLCCIGPISEEIANRIIVPTLIWLAQLAVRGAIGANSTPLNLRREMHIRVIVSSIIFGLYHRNPIQVVWSAVDGLAYGYLQEKTSCLALSILVHAGHNFISEELVNLAFKATRFGTAPTLTAVAAAVLTTLAYDVFWLGVAIKT